MEATPIGAVEQENQVAAIMQRISEARKNKDVADIRSLISRTDPPLVVEALEQLDTEYLIFFIKSLKQSDVGTWFNYLSSQKQEELIVNLPNPDVQKVIDELYSDELVDMIDEMPPELVKKILSLSSSETRKTVNSLLSYKDGEAGSVMNTDFTVLKENQTVRQALATIRDNRQDSEDHEIYYITNDDGELVGKTTLRDLVFVKTPSKRLKKIMSKSLSVVNTRDDVEKIAKLFNKFDKQAIPVVNAQGKLVGVITDNDIIDVVIEETTEDINKMAGIGELKYSYLKASVWSVVKSRIFWLSILMVSATLSSIVIDQFSTLGQTLTVGLSTALLIPIMTVISGSSGNAGSQASVSVIRGLTIGEIGPRQYAKVMWKEARVAFFLGAMLACLNMARLAVYFAIFDPKNNINQLSSATSLAYSPYQLAMLVSGASSLSLWVAIFLSKVVGGALPLVATRMNIDPAVMAAPILTTLVDALSTAIFFAIGIAALLIAV